MQAHFRHAGPRIVVQWPEAEKGTWEPAVTRAKVLPFPANLRGWPDYDTKALFGNGIPKHSAPW